MRKLTKVSLLLLAAVMVLASCGSTDNAVYDEEGIRTLRLSTTAALTTVDPHVTVNIQDNIVLYQMYEGVYRKNEATGEYEPRLAESYEVSEDGMTYTFKIREGVKFHNGDDLKISDIIFSFARSQEKPQSRARMNGVVNFYEGEGHTLVVELEQPNAAFINSIASAYIVSEREVTEQGDAFGTKVSTAGTGPYYMTYVNHDVEWTLEAFPDYYLGEVDIKRVHFVPISDVSAGLISFEAGELDWYTAPIANWAALVANPNYKTQLVEANHISAVMINYEHGPLGDDNLRKAIAYAINKEAMNMACYDGYAVIADYMIQPVNTAAPTTGLVYDYDLDKAREYLAQSAYPDGVHVGTISCSAGGYFEKMAQVLQANLAEIGIETDIQRLDSATNMNNCRTQNFDIVVTGLNATGDYETFRAFSHSAMVGSYYVKYEGDKFDYKRIDELWDAGIATTNIAERTAIYRELNDMLTDTATMLPVFHRVQPYVWIQDIEIPANTSNYPRIFEWSWVQ